MFNASLDKQTKESIKEFGRVVLIAVLPVLLTYLETPEMTFRAFAVAVVIASLKALDKFLHVRGKEKGEDGYLKTKGLTGF